MRPPARLVTDESTRAISPYHLAASRPALSRVEFVKSTTESPPIEMIRPAGVAISELVLPAFAASLLTAAWMKSISPPCFAAIVPKLSTMTGFAPGLDGSGMKSMKAPAPLAITRPPLYGARAVTRKDRRVAVEPKDACDIKTIGNGEAAPNHVELARPVDGQTEDC